MIEVVQGDARGLPLADGTVQCVVTSPPYWGLRDYGTARWVGGDVECEHSPADTPTRRGLASSTLRGGKQTTGHQREGYSEVCGRCGAVRVDAQIGLERTPEEYVGHVVEVFREVRRVLRDDGTVWLNLGDSYAGGGRGGNPEDSAFRKQATNLGSLVSRSPVPDGIKPKDLVGIPWMVAFALRADGWWLRSEIIWHKPNPMPESVTDRPTKSHEQVFLLSKSGTAQFWTHEYGERNGTRVKPEPDYEWRHRVTGEWTRVEPAGDWREEWTRRNLWEGHDYFYDAEAVTEPVSENTHARISQDLANQVGSFRANGGGKTNGPMKAVVRGSTRKIAEAGSGIKANESFETAFVLKMASRNNRSVWTVATQSYSGAHFATFPEKLVEPCVLAGTSARGACPRCGAGWVRVVEKGLTAHDGETQSAYEGGTTANRLALLRQAARARGGEYVNEAVTVGWRPGCDCDAGDPVPQIVLDPFAGTGTVGRVCARHGRSFVGVELKGEYIGLAMERMSGVQMRMME